MESLERVVGCHQKLTIVAASNAITWRSPKELAPRDVKVSVAGSGYTATDPDIGVAVRCSGRLRSSCATNTVTRDGAVRRGGARRVKARRAGLVGSNPAFHTAVFVLTCQLRPAIWMEGGATFHFIDARVPGGPREKIGARVVRPASGSSSGYEEPGERQCGRRSPLPVSRWMASCRRPEPPYEPL